MDKKLHTADHVLYTILSSNYAATTEFMAFKDKICRVGYKCLKDLTLLKKEIEDKTNQLIQEGHRVVSYKMQRDEAEKIVDLSLVPKNIEEITIYEIEGVNKIACAGPHVENTSEIGKFVINKIKKIKNDIYSIQFHVE